VSVDDDLTRWKFLADQAKQGLLTLNPEAATVYAAACQTLISGLASTQDAARYATLVDGLGGFAWSNELRDGLKGVVDGPDNSVKDTLDKYLRVAQLMSDTVSASVRTLTGQDAETGRAIGNAERP
jgi:hypothetical protein